MAYVELEKLINLYDGYQKVFRVNGVELLLIQEAGKTFLLKNQCPHMGKSLANASVDPNSVQLRCPFHGLEFDLVSGENINNRGNPCQPLTRYPIAYEGKTMGVDI